MKKTLFYILIFTAAYFLVRINHFQLAPDWMGLSSFDKPGEYFQLILNVTASIFGIIIAVTLLTFQLLVKDYPLRNKKNNLFNNNFIVFTISLPISVILLSLFSYITIKKIDQTGTLTATYYISLLFLTFVICLFPAVKNILSISDSLKNTLKDINQISIESIRQILPLQNEKFVAKEKEILSIKIRNRLTHYVRECDYETYNSALQELNKKIRFLLQDGHDRRLSGDIFTGFKFIIEPGIYEAFRVNNFQYFITVWECIDELYEYGAKKKIPLMNYEYLSSFVDEYISFLVNNRLSDALRKGSEIIIKAFELNLKFNCPKEENIHQLYWMYDEANATNLPDRSDQSGQWMKIDQIFSDFENIYMKSVDLKDRELYQSCYWSTSQILFDIKYGDLRNLTPFFKRRIIESIFSLRTEAADMANKSNLYDYFGWTFHMDELTIEEFIKGQQPYVRFILERTGDFLIKSQTLRKINDDALNNLGGIARLVCAAYKTNETATKAINYIFEIFMYLKEYIEQNQLPSESKNYIRIKQQMQSIKFYLVKHFPSQPIDLINKIDEQVSTFKDVKENPDFFILSWN